MDNNPTRTRWLIDHYDADTDQHADGPADVTSERALWLRYARTMTPQQWRITMDVDADVLCEQVVRFAGDFLPDAVYEPMYDIDPGRERAAWIAAQPPQVRADCERRNRLLTVAVSEWLAFHEGQLPPYVCRVPRPRRTAPQPTTYGQHRLGFLNLPSLDAPRSRASTPTTTTTFFAFQPSE